MVKAGLLRGGPWISATLGLALPLGAAVYLRFCPAIGSADLSRHSPARDKSLLVDAGLSRLGRRDLRPPPPGQASLSPREAPGGGSDPLRLAGMVHAQAPFPPQPRVEWDESELYSTSLSMHYRRSAIATETAVPDHGLPRPLSFFISRRPPLYPFLVSLAHDLLGPSTENPYYVNARAARHSLLSPVRRHAPYLWPP